MVCPKCGAQIPEGYLMCEDCGTEIQMVPDFESDVEIQINDIMADVSDTLVETVKEEVNETTDPAEEVLPEPEQAIEELAEEDFDDNPFNDSEVSVKTRVRIGLILISAAVIVGLLCFLMFLVVQNNSPEHFVGKAREMAEKGAYEEAVAFLEKAQDKDPSDADILFMKADFELRNHNDEAAVAVWNSIIDDNNFKDNIKFMAYDKLIRYYEDKKEFQAINTVLINCKYDTIVSSYQNFLANKPEFSAEEGTYDEIISLKLNSNTSGKIYYTTDGSVPTEKSNVYSGPITLENGEYVISAVFVNVYGIKSETAVKRYNIALVRPEQPEVSLESGTYYEPKMIAVLCESGCRIFYTTDGSEPTQDSVPYTGSIPMPLGSTEFKFVTMNNAGIYSEPLIRSYELKLSDAIPTQTAVELLINELIDKGYLEDKEGHRANTNGCYSYDFSSVIRTADEKDYYTINEYFDDGTGVPVRTDVVYLAGVTDGEIARLGFNDVGRFTAVPF